MMRFVIPELIHSTGSWKSSQVFSRLSARRLPWSTRYTSRPRLDAISTQRRISGEIFVQELNGKTPTQGNYLRHRIDGSEYALRLLSHDELHGDNFRGVGFNAVAERIVNNRRCGAGRWRGFVHISGRESGSEVAIVDFRPRHLLGTRRYESLHILVVTRCRPDQLRMDTAGFVLVRDFHL